MEHELFNIGDTVTTTGRTKLWNPFRVIHVREDGAFVAIDIEGDVDWHNVPGDRDHGTWSRVEPAPINLWANLYASGMIGDSHRARDLADQFSGDEFDSARVAVVHVWSDESGYHAEIEQP